MTRLNTDNVAVFLSVGTPAADSHAPRTEPETKPFDAFLRRAGQSRDTGTEDAARASESGPPPSEEIDPIDAQSNSTEQALVEPTEATDKQSDDETDEQVDAASAERSDDNTDGKEQAAIRGDVTEIGSTGGGQETRDDADSAAEEARSRDSRAAMKNRHEDRQNESGAGPAAKPAATSGRSEQAVQAPVEPEASTESEDKPEEKASAQSRIDNPLDPTVSPPGRRTSSEESRRQTGRQGSTRAAAGDKETPAVDRSSPVAKTLAGQEQVAVDEIGAAPEETKSETQEKTVKPASTADVKATSATPPKAWSPEGLRSAPAPSTSDGSQTDQVDRVRFVQRVARAFEALGDGNGSVRLRLRPPELGGLRLEVSIRNGMMTAHIETETSAARTLLLDSLPALRERLAQQDIKVDSFEVDLGDRSPDGSPQRPDDDRQPRDRPDEKKARAPENQDGDTADGGSVGAVTRTGEGARLDVVV